MPTHINYDPDVNKNSGTLDIENVNNMRPRDRNTLLHLLFWLCSDTEGRAFLAKWKPKNHPVEDVKGALTLEFQSRLDIANPATKADVIAALVAGHLAADAFVAAKEANDTATADAEQQKYLKNMSVVMWQLNEDVSGHEFSLNW